MYFIRNKLTIQLLLFFEKITNILIHTTTVSENCKQLYQNQNNYVEKPQFINCNVKYDKLTLIVELYN